MSATLPTPPTAPRLPLARRPLAWLRTQLRRPLRFEWRGMQIHLVLGPPPPPPTPAVSPGEALRRCHAELGALLGRHPEARHLMRHLSFVEQAIARAGSRALRQDVPVLVLRKALSQLELLIRDEPSAALEEMRSRFEQAIAARARSATEDDAVGPPSQVQVSEASHSLFDEMERSWTGQMPLPEGARAQAPNA